MVPVGTGGPWAVLGALVATVGGLAALVVRQLSGVFGALAEARAALTEDLERQAQNLRAELADVKAGHARSLVALDERCEGELDQLRAEIVALTARRRRP